MATLPLTHLDTHIAVWLAAGELPRFSPDVRKHLARNLGAISPMVRIELGYLHEIGRLKSDEGAILHRLNESLGVVTDLTFFDAIANEAISLAWTRDPLDRIITAHARAAGAWLLTRDQTILAHEPRAFWDRPPAAALPAP